jgi:hypothetical protein
MVIISLLVNVLLITQSYADGYVVDKVYHPYVLPNEQEIEWRLFSRQTESGNKLAQRVAYGFSLSERMTLETYLLGERDANDADNYGLKSYEVEVRWMLTEQGELWADWGTLFELQKQHDSNDWELSSGLLFEKEYGKASLAINLFLIYEWGDNLTSEFETEFRLQYRYRYMAQIQPAIELYTGQDYIGIGPAFLGIQRFERQKQLKWEMGFIVGFNNESKDNALRVAIEYEF